MTVSVWQPGTLYLPGANVRPVSSGALLSVPIDNAGFEDGDSDWTKETGWTITNAGSAFAGTWSAQFDSTTTGNRVISDTVALVTPGQVIAASCRVNRGTSAEGVAWIYVAIVWLDDMDAEISMSNGLIFGISGDGEWVTSTVTGTAPAGAAKARIAAVGHRASGSSVMWCDSFVWNASQTFEQTGLIFRATQTDPATSGSDEPAWPIVAAGTVVDGGVTWTAVTASRVVWEASPIMTTGSTEPTWPNKPGTSVSDNGEISWETIGRNIQDENCPNTKVVAIVASKVFAVDDDIVKFCATVNPLDWTSRDDAGYLPTGIQQANSNGAAVLGIYRSNLVVFNASTFQMWQVDPDPAAMALLDQMEGIGSIWPKAVQAVGDDLFFLSQLGARTVGIAAGSSNLAAGDVGDPIDPLVHAAIIDLALSGRQPIATYYPGAGQYWLAFPEYEQ